MAWFKQEEGGDRWQRIVDKSDGPLGANGYSLVADPAKSYALCASEWCKLSHRIFCIRIWMSGRTSPQSLMRMTLPSM